MKADLADCFAEHRARAPRGRPRRRWLFDAVSKPPAALPKPDTPEFLRAGAASSLAKLQATEAAGRIVDRAVQIHGGQGVVVGSIVERLYREVRALRIYEGTSEIQRLIVARELLQELARRRAGLTPGTEHGPLRAPHLRLRERPAARRSARLLRGEGLARKVRARVQGGGRAARAEGRVRANSAGCLDQCANGVTVVIYPEQTWYGRVTVADVPEIVDALAAGRVVERLRIPDEKLTGRAGDRRRGGAHESDRRPRGPARRRRSAESPT